MDIRVHFVGVAPSNAAAIILEVERRVWFALDRLAHSIRSVRVSLGDVNGPRGGVDQQCVMTVTPSGEGEPVVARALSESRAAAVVQSLKRVRRQFGKHLARRRSANA